MFQDIPYPGHPHREVLARSVEPARLQVRVPQVGAASRHAAAAACRAFRWGPPAAVPASHIQPGQEDLGETGSQAPLPLQSDQRLPPHLLR